MINSEKLNEMLLDCLFKDDEVKDRKLINEDDAIYVDSIGCRFGLHKGRLENHREDIKEMIEQLPESFKEGDSFLNLCITKDEEQWTGFHSVCEQLMVLGIACGYLEYTMPCAFWELLPGGLPVLKVIIDEQ